MLFENALHQIGATLEKHLSTKTVIGEPMTVGELTLIPVMDVTFGFGAGWGEGKASPGDGTGSGGGAGARISPKAVIVVRDGDIQVLPLSKGSAAEKIVEAIPGLLEKFKPQPSGSQTETKAE
ncbi:MAG TPA: spore germination protein GerW family protein [Symbiobacteriaceae bacterium]